MSVLGVDIGVTGGIALLTDEGTLINVWEMPCLQTGPKNRRRISPALLAERIRQSQATRAFVEAVGPRPQEGGVGAFAFGDSHGVVRTALEVLGIPTVFIQPAQWKKTLRLPPGKDGAKDRARSEAIRRWPNQAALFAKKGDDGKAEAALIAVAGLLAFDSRVAVPPLLRIAAGG